MLTFLGISIALLVYLRKVRSKSFVKYPIQENYLDIQYGDNNARVKVFLFMDYNCIHCRNFLINTLPLVKKEFIDSGLMKLNIKLLDFSNNLNIRNAYKMAICLNQYGDFEEINKLLLLETNAVFSDDFVDVFDELIERNSSFAECVISGLSEEYLEDNAYIFIKNQFEGTPTFIINNKIFKGFMDFNAFSKIISDEIRILN